VRLCPRAGVWQPLREAGGMPRPAHLVQPQRFWVVGLSRRSARLARVRSLEIGKIFWKVKQGLRSR
jgi:hypothetical protein